MERISHICSINENLYQIKTNENLNISKFKYDNLFSKLILN